MIFIVEMSSSNLLGCSVPEQNVVGKSDPVTRVAQPIRADQVGTAVVRDLAKAAMGVDPGLGWARFAGTAGFDVQAGGYDAHVKQIDMPVRLATAKTRPQGTKGHPQLLCWDPLSRSEERRVGKEC